MRAMQLMSEILLENKITELQNKTDLNSKEKMALSYCKKELEIIRQLKFIGIDMTGTCNEVKERIKKQEIHFFEKQEYEQLCEKANKYDVIAKIVVIGDSNEKR